MQTCPGDGGQAHGVAGVGRDLRAVEDDIEHALDRSVQEARRRMATAWASIERSRSLRSWDSLGACTDEVGSPAPVRRMSASGSFAGNAATNGIEPPTPISAGARSQANGTPCFPAAKAGPAVTREDAAPGALGSASALA